MLIRGFRARNFMKFHDLAVEEIPAQGLLGIEGSNEGGKSTLGELVQFALFGKTLSSVASSLDDLINWDRDECSVELDFDVEDGSGMNRSYRIYRQIDKYGTNYAKLSTLPDRGELATGLIRVQETMSKLLRFSFEDFTRSFFLAEKEFPRSPQEMRHYLDRMVGADVLQSAAQEARLQIGGFEEKFEKLQNEIHRNEQQIEKYVPNIAKLPEAEKQREHHAQQSKEQTESKEKIERAQEQLERMVRAREAYRDRLKSLGKQMLGKLGQSTDHLLEGYPSPVTSPLLKGSQKDVERVRGRLGELKRVVHRSESVAAKAESVRSSLHDRLEGSGKDSYPSRRRQIAESVDRARGGANRWRAFGLVSLLLAIGGGVFAAGAHLEWFSVGPEANSQQIVLIAGVAAGLFLILTIVSFVRAAGQGGRAIALESELSGLDHDEKHDRAIHDQLAGLQRDTRLEEFALDIAGCGHAEVDAETEEFANERSKLLGDGGDLSAFGIDLGAQENRIVQRLKTTEKQLAKDLDKVEETLKREIQRRDRSENDIREYEKQAGRKAGLEEQNREIGLEAEGIRTEMETRQLLCEMLDETVESVRHRAGPSLGKTMRRLLPSLTGGRYKDLKITPQFDLQVFTSEKSDFLAQHELSGGTFEGLSLGFRLAFTQAFIRAVVRVPQFLFLDEPFKAMDSERVHRTLRALLRLSPELRQIFVIIPGIKDQDREIFDHVYQVFVGENELQTGMADSVPPSADGLRAMPADGRKASSADSLKSAPADLLSDEQGPAVEIPNASVPTEPEIIDPFRNSLDSGSTDVDLDDDWGSLADTEVRPEADDPQLS